LEAFACSEGRDARKNTRAERSLVVRHPLGLVGHEVRIVTGLPDEVRMRCDEGCGWRGTVGAPARVVVDSEISEDVADVPQPVPLFRRQFAVGFACTTPSKFVLARVWHAMEGTRPARTIWGCSTPIRRTIRSDQEVTD